MDSGLGIVHKLDYCRIERPLLGPPTVRCGSTSPLRGPINGGALRRLNVGPGPASFSRSTTFCKSSTTGFKSGQSCRFSWASIRDLGLVRLRIDSDRR